jgi:Raf kinase inhibitor-like YbhB/YbcL family protein
MYLFPLGGRYMGVRVKPLTLLIALPLLALSRSAIAQNLPALSVTSPAFTAGAAIPDLYTCKNPNAGSPPLSWKGTPSNAKTLALIVKDPDAPRGTFIHWVVYNLPSSIGELRANVPHTANLANGGLQGVNTEGQIGYMGPCPPPGSAPHHYHFELSALDTALDLKPGATAADLETAARGHVIAGGELLGTFAR